MADGFIGEDGKVAKAVVLCIRPSSNPISNEKFLACFSLFGKKTISTANGNKIYIEINPELVNDPTLIKDEGTSTDFAL
ncbi:MAG: hypothetical protein LBG59_07975 [Candidatus Peribacteria bacterium]|nr:hypothetical protein [Candidatus Peribacteria bacterium]